MKLIASFMVGGEPVAKERPRLGKNGNVYTPAKTKDHEDRIGWEFKIAARGHKPVADKRYALDVLFVVGSVARADIDNMLKTVLDGLNKVAYADDKQVDRVIVGKETVGMGVEPHTSVTLYELEADDHIKRIRYKLVSPKLVGPSDV